MDTKTHVGLHLMANLHGVSPDNEVLHDKVTCQKFCIDAVENAGLSMVGNFFHAFGEGGGVTGVVVLAESHVAIHTWPEVQYVTLDVFVCNYQRDNSSSARRLFDALIGAMNAAQIKRYETIRG